MKKLLLLLTTLCLSQTSVAYNALTPAEVVAKELVNTDCALNAEECRYYVAIEYIAYKNACLKVLKSTELEIKNANAWVDEWDYLKPDKFKNEVLNPDNKFVKVYENKIYEYLSKMPINEIGNECSRLIMIKENRYPDNFNDILKQTLNYKKPVKEND